MPQQLIAFGGGLDRFAEHRLSISPQLLVCQARTIDPSVQVHDHDYAGGPLNPSDYSPAPKALTLKIGLWKKMREAFVF